MQHHDSFANSSARPVLISVSIDLSSTNSAPACENSFLGGPAWCLNPRSALRCSFAVGFGGTGLLALQTLYPSSGLWLLHARKSEQLPDTGPNPSSTLSRNVAFRGFLLWVKPLVTEIFQNPSIKAYTLIHNKDP